MNGDECTTERPVVGVIALESSFLKPIGHIREPAGFDFPIRYQVIPGATIDRLIRERDPALLQPFIAAAQALEREGVKAITGSCGFLALHQAAIAAAVEVPVFMSSLLQVPLVSRFLTPAQKVGVVVANSEALSKEHLAAVGIADEPLVIAGMQHQPQFAEVILQGAPRPLDLERFAAELDEVVQAMLQAHPEVGALVLECTDLSHFAPGLQRRFGLPGV